jgi:hypothetical protein
MAELRATFGSELGAIAVTAVFLFGFGIGYNWLVLQVSRKGYSEGYTWLLVVVGVAVTVAAAGFTIGWTAVLLLLIYFAASGLPMALGDIWRKVQAEAVERRERDDKTA